MKKQILILVAVLAGIVPSAFAVRIADIARLDGERTNTIIGWGLVGGLNGTGDGGEYAPAIKPLAQLLTAMGNFNTVRELADTKNVAVVMVMATVPKEGAVGGDALNAQVFSMGAAKSLAGGHLFVTNMTGPSPEAKEVLALASGAIEIEDRSTPTRGVIKSGVKMEANLMPPVITSDWKISLVLDPNSAAWGTASRMAVVINEAATNSGETLAIARSDKLVEVTIPEADRADSAGFISRIMGLPVPLVATEARVVINSKTGTITMTGDVEISPCIISDRGLTISTVTPAPVPTPRTPVVTEKHAVALDPGNQGGAKLKDLLDALDAIRVPAEQRINIIRQLHETGSLHAKLIEAQQN